MEHIWQHSRNQNAADNLKAAPWEEGSEAYGGKGQLNG